MPAMRLPGRRVTPTAKGQAQTPPFIVCPACRLRNDITARFCRDCGLPLGGPRDPVRGTTRRRAELPSDRGAGIAALLGLVSIVVIAGIVGYLVLRGFETTTTTAGGRTTSGTPPVSAASSGVPGASVMPAPTRDAMPTDDPAPPGEATDDPSVDPTEGPTGAPTDEPADRPTAEPPPTRTGWTCDEAAIQDPLQGRWRIAKARWGRQDSFDRLAFDLTRLEGSARKGAVVRMEFLRPGRAASRYGVATPEGDRALVITFDGPLSLRSAMEARPGLTSLASLEARTDDEGLVHAVIGVAGDGCARLVANDWRDGSDRTTQAKLIVDIQR